MIYGTLNESDSISPSDEKEKRFTNCECCCAIGTMIIDGIDEDGNIYIEKIKCDECHGEGQIEIED